MIQENRVLGMVFYPTMVFAHGLMVYTCLRQLLRFNFSIQWIFTHFFPKMSALIAKIVDQILILTFNNHFGSSTSSHMARYLEDYTSHY